MENLVDFTEVVLRMVEGTDFRSGQSLTRQQDIVDVLERCYEYLILVDGVGNNIMPLINSVRELIQAIKSVVEVETLLTSRRVRGRPRIEVDTEQLEYLVETGFRVKDIAEMLHCSKRTIERRMSELSLRASDYSCISEGDLDDKVSELLSIHRQIGEKMLIGHLRSQGHKIQRQRVRDAIRRVDPLGIELRSRTVLHRRTYCVKFPNSLWHLDGYHKLIRWKLVIHGGIDGFSRLVVFLKVSTNNYSRTVLSAFTSAVEEFGIPSRIRIDRGGENVMVTRWMLEHPHRGPDRHSVIAGRSVHNQRIERLWRDLFSSCVCFFYSFFYYLEDVGILNKDDSRDLTALHFLFVPLVQQQLDMFREGWAHHSLRTMNNRTPLQLWTLGLSLANSVEPGSSEVNGLLENDSHMYGIDWDGPAVSEDSSSTVEVENLPSILSDQQKEELGTLISTTPTCLSDEWMISSFTLVKTYIYQHCNSF